MVRALVVVLFAVMAVAVSPSVAVANCVGPQIKHNRAPVERDGTVHVVGSGWGDNCYDTGEPPDGEGVLGRPATGIEIYLVQDDVEHLVAIGDADERYAFTVDVPVPDGLEPGSGEVIARTPSNERFGSVTAGSLVISDAPPTGSSVDDPIRFSEAGQGPVTTTTTAPPASGTVPPASSDTPSSEADDNGGASPVVVAGVALVVGLVAAGVYLARRRRG